jgi:hypothetical protein
VTAPIVELCEFVRDSLGEADDGTIVDVFMTKVAIKDGVDPVKFAALIEAAEHGEFQEVSVERLKAGPSYIELGAWLGDQTMALMFMALGEVLGFWKIISPTTLGVKDPAVAGDMAGRGFVMISGYNPTT